MAAKGTLEVHLHAGKDMRNVEFFGQNDPYALLSYKTQDQKSKTLEGGGSDPVWDQSFFFEVDDDVADVIIKIFDEDKRSKDDCIGEAKIPIGGVLEELEVPASLFDLVRANGDTQGQVKVSLKFVPTENKPQPAPFHPERPHQPYANHVNHPHHGGNGNGPYGDSNDGGWQ